MIPTVAAAAAVPQNFTTFFKRCQHQNNKIPFAINGTNSALNS
jgi:hypothetical protein